MNRLVLKTRNNKNDEVIELTYDLEKIEFDYEIGELTTVYADVELNSKMEYRKYKEKKGTKK